MPPPVLEEVLGALLRAKNLTLALGESCTGGLVGQRITSVPGSSDYFLLSVVTYSNEMKQTILNVPHSLLVKEGAVSAPVAEAMATGALQVADSDIGAGITGIAGPSGGAPEKPVGLVFVAVSSKKGEARIEQFQFDGARKEVRDQAADAALQMIIEEAEKL